MGLLIPDPGEHSMGVVSLSWSPLRKAKASGLFPEWQVRSLGHGLPLLWQPLHPSSQSSFPDGEPCSPFMGEEVARGTLQSLPGKLWRTMASLGLGWFLLDQVSALQPFRNTRLSPEAAWLFRDSRDLASLASGYPASLCPPPSSVAQLGGPWPVMNPGYIPA